MISIICMAIIIAYGIILGLKIILKLFNIHNLKLIFTKDGFAFKYKRYVIYDNSVYTITENVTLEFPKEQPPNPF